MVLPGNRKFLLYFCNIYHSVSGYSALAVGNKNLKQSRLLFIAQIRTRRTFYLRKPVKLVSHSCIRSV